MQRVFTCLIRFFVGVLLSCTSAIAAAEENCDWFGQSVCFRVDWQTVTPAQARSIPQTLTDQEERTPLHWAVHYSYDVGVINTMLSAKADVRAVDKFKNTPLHDAAWFNTNPAIIKTLLAAGADINARDRFGQTPLHDAASNTNPIIVKTLLAAGADVNARRADGGTPLHWAVLHNQNPAVVQALLDGGANPKATNKDGRTPLTLMQNNPTLQNTKIYQILKSRSY